MTESGIDIYRVIFSVRGDVSVEEGLRPIPTRPICSRPMAIVGRLELADWIGV